MPDFARMTAAQRAKWEVFGTAGFLTFIISVAAVAVWSREPEQAKVLTPPPGYVCHSLPKLKEQVRELTLLNRSEWKSEPFYFYDKYGCATVRFGEEAAREAAGGLLPVH